MMRSSAIKPEVLCPTERAIYYHSLRVYLQVCQWRIVDEQIMEVTDWEWSKKDGVLTPIKADMPAAPQFITNFIHCNCKITSNNACGTMRCSCLQNGIPCMEACGECRGLSCNNPNLMKKKEEDNDDDDDDDDGNVFDVFNEF